MKALPLRCLIYVLSKAIWVNKIDTEDPVIALPLATTDIINFL